MRIWVGASPMNDGIALSTGMLPRRAGVPNIVKTNSMINTVKVSVIVPVYNAEATLRACLESLLDLDYPEESRELIFVDNASTDNTPEILKRFGRQIRVVFEPKRGPAAARNRGLRQASHEVVAMTDADCIVQHDGLRHLVEPLSDSTVGLVGGTILSKRPCNTIELFGETIHDHRMAIEVWTPPYVITMNWASRKSALQSVDCFDDSFLRGEDCDLSYRLVSDGWRFAFAPRAVVRHQNEITFSGLFHEGYLHGFYSVPLIKKHRILLRQLGHKRIQRSAYAALLASVRASVCGPNKAEARCDLVFNSGKRLGKLWGSVRFAYVDL